MHHMECLSRVWSVNATDMSAPWCGVGELIALRNLLRASPLEDNLLKFQDLTWLNVSHQLATLKRIVECL